MTDLTTGDDPDLDLFLDKIKNEYKDGWSEENWEEEMEKHPEYNDRLKVSVCDLAKDVLPEPQKMDLTSLIFVLSAIVPEKHF